MCAHQSERVMTKIESNKSANTEHLTAEQLNQFNRDGYLVIRNLCGEFTLREMAAVIEDSLRPPIAPVEYESDVNYPGSPAARQAPGGDTARRLLNALARDHIFRTWATNTCVVSYVCQMLGTDSIELSQNHHNCIMTKHPGYGSSTNWHQDIRYWTFDRPELVTVWLALGCEHEKNGSLSVIPGSHRMNLDRGRFDAEIFLRDDLEENQKLIRTACNIELNAGDVLFFHCRLLHAAGRNYTDSIKISTVFTYHAADNQPIENTRSAVHPEIWLSNQ